MKKTWILFFIIAFSTVVAEEKQPMTWDEHFEIGINAFDQKDFEQALISFGKAELESTEVDKIHYNKGLCHLKLDEHDLAEKELTKALRARDPLLKLKARYNLAHVHYNHAIIPSSDEGSYTYDEDKLTTCLDFFRDVKREVAKEPLNKESEALQLAQKADENIKLVVARLKIMRDRENSKKGEKVPFIQGTLQVNGRPVGDGRLYLKSKWEDQLLGTLKSDPSGTFKFDELEMGKYQIAGALYETESLEQLSFNEPVKVPTYEKDNQDIKLSGPLSMACPYQASVLPLKIPHSDSSRASGPDSITSSTDWGELTDGKPEDLFPEDHDLDPGYVGFDVPEFQIAMALPSPPQNPQAGHPEESKEEKPEPTYNVTLKGFHDDVKVVLPDLFQVYGFKKDMEKPELLYTSAVSTTDPGKYSWSSGPFPHKDFRHLIFTFQKKGKGRISLHEIEVQEDTGQNQSNQDQQQNENQDQNQQQQKQQQQKQQEEQKKNEPSRSTRSILSRVRKKNEDEKDKRQTKSGIILKTDRDY